ncbi:MAG: hypothetical protein A2474_07905 [Elusimicrobia bacterium RIFOXYC2_FULL_34_12]|nr:MAG: hypothetical protein A2474_07905 [Elusimicrobia bacterium RIFOXYC2_FULL_34_12]OGS39496.1 MAG: hypothetical protein A2551_00155 [Elusimicrobia bacterium RIFOXYD2_FULL_34_30]
MKKMNQSFSQNFKMPHLFREDLEKIEDVIKELSPHRYGFEIKDFEYETIQEIPEDTETLNNFKIQTYDPYISLNLNNFSASIYSNSNDIKVIGAIKKIIDIILVRERKFRWFLAKKSWLLLVAFEIIYAVIIILLCSVRKIIFLNAIFPLLFIAFIWSIISWNLSIRNFSITEFIYQKNKSNFFKKNKDQIILMVFAAIIGSLATIFFQKIFK